VGPADTESVWARLLGRCRALYHKTRVHGTGDRLPAGRLLFQRPRSLIATSIFFLEKKNTGYSCGSGSGSTQARTYSQLEGRDR
jgi:hypothetical protein